MLLTKKSVELLAPAGNWDVLETAVEAGADAVYLGGRHFNMRMHEGDMNFSDEMLKKAIDYTHAHGVKLYVTINNLISDEELPALKEYLSYLNEIRPDAILVQDLAVIKLVNEMNIKIPMHASVMMNTHNTATIRKLQEYGITRVVTSREMTLDELALFKADTGIEVEYFVHGDICISESGQCIHSGVLFGQSGNRGRCLKPCRWPYKLIDDNTGEILDDTNPYKLAIKDMCMYRNLPELIQAGVRSFKIEGRMRPAPFIKRIVSVYRKAIDSYMHDPAAWQTDDTDWKALYDNRARDFTTSFALGKPDRTAIGFSGKREPRFFSSAVKEAGFQDEILRQKKNISCDFASTPRLSVRVSSKTEALAVLDAGADVVYIGGEVWRPERPVSVADIQDVIAKAHSLGKKVLVSTPRTATRREFSEMEQLMHTLQYAPEHADGVLVNSLGMLDMVSKCTDFPIQADYGFNTFNHISAEFLMKNGCCMAVSSYELSYEQLREIVEKSKMPIEVVVHGSYESMIIDHNLAEMSLGGYDPISNPEFNNRHYALLDEAGEKHSLRMDQYGRNHILFANDMCLYPYLEKFSGVASYRIEAKDYTPEYAAKLTSIYRRALDRISAGEDGFSDDDFKIIKEDAPRGLGIGTYRFHQSRNSI